MGEEITELDARGLNCPLPVLKAQKRLKSMPSGARLRVLATDPKAPGDFAAFCDAQGHQLIESAGDSEYTIIIARK